jgi:hypothetical protein
MFARIISAGSILVFQELELYILVPCFQVHRQFRKMAVTWINDSIEMLRIVLEL